MASVADILGIVPEFIRLDPFSQNEVCRATESRLSLLAWKLRASPYQPVQDQAHSPNVNTDLLQATLRWLQSIPQEHRLGALVALLSTIYITRAELDALMDDAAEQFAEYVFHLEKEPINWSWPLSTDARARVKPFAVSGHDAYDRLVHRLQLTGSVSSSPTHDRATLSASLYPIITSLAHLAEFGSAYIYFEAARKPIKDVAEGWLGNYLLLVEDCSLSGTTISSDLTRLIGVLRALYSNHVKVLTRKRKSPPRVAVLIGFATKQAVDRILKTVWDIDKQLSVPVFCGIVERDARLDQRLPAALDTLCRHLSTVRDPRVALSEAVDYYAPYFHAYLQQTGMLARHPQAASWRWGFKDGGFAVVTYLNAPNNDLPLLWCPPPRPGGPNLRPLFPRVESRVDHDRSAADNMDTLLQAALSDKNGHIQRLLDEVYGGLS
jgi:hypothetical protein